MSAPDRIWAWKYSGQHTEGQWRSSLGACPTKGYECTEYVRADLLAAAQARIEALEGALRRTEANRDACMQDANEEYARAEQAEAEVKRIIAAYRLEAMRRDDYTHAAFDQHIAALSAIKEEE